MNFNSLSFIVFLLLILPVNRWISDRYRWMVLLAASYFFYMCWNPAYIILIIISTMLDYVIALNLTSSPNEKTRRKGLIMTLVSNLGLLFFFKYFNFFQDSIADLLSLFHLQYHPVKQDFLLPVGISFYTFQTLSYSIDVYWQRMRPERHVGKFALFVAFFPQLVAGPIERAEELLPQFHRRPVFRSNDFISGFSQMMLGFFKKVVVADTLAIQVNAIYNHYELYNGASLLMATYLFAFQIYCDFSGYSDIGIGVARMMGYKLNENFRIPYFSKSVTEFWRRWHISLSSWLRDYLYIPLGGNRKGKFKTYRNLMYTMLLGGLWHGASWNFVIWGGLNGLYLSGEKLLGIDKIRNNTLSLFRRGIHVFIVFNLICLTWVFFRAGTFTQAIVILGKIIHIDAMPVIIDNLVFFNLAVGLVILLFMEYFIFRKAYFPTLVKKWNVIGLAIFSMVMMMLILLFGVSEGSQFIYFQF